MPRRLLFPLLLLCLLAGVTLWYVTPAGLGLMNDSAAYLAGARSLLAGTGYSDLWLEPPLEPITHYPPFYSLSLAALSALTGLDAYRAARALHLLLVPLNALLVGALAWRNSRRLPEPLLAAALFIFGEQLFIPQTYVMSETLFFSLSLLTLLLTDAANRLPARRERWIALGGLFAGLTLLTRYSGLALFAALPAFWLLQPNPWRKRLQETLAFLLGGALPAAAWAARNALVAGNLTNRGLYYPPIQAKTLRDGLYSLAQFALPLPSWQTWLFKQEILLPALLLLGAFILAGWLLWQALTQKKLGLTWLWSAYLLGYAAAVAVSLTFFDASTPLSARILAPLYLSWNMLLVAGLGWLWQRKNRWAQGAALTLTALALTGSLWGWTQTVPTLRETGGAGYASWRWRQAPVMQALQTLPSETRIYTNSPAAVYLVTGRASRMIDSAINPVTRQPRSGYAQSLATMLEQVRAGEAVIALFDVPDLVKIIGDPSLLEAIPTLVRAQGDTLLGAIAP